MRSRFQGITNIVRFNWHFYVIAAALILIGLVVAPLLSPILKTILYLGMGGAALTTLISLVVSFQVYDRSRLYDLDWHDEFSIPANPVIANINAGFDETSTIIETKYPTARLLIWDFYDERKHTEVSIKRARTAYPPHPATRKITTTQLPQEAGAVDLAVLFMAAHEVRDPGERSLFLAELRRILKPSGRLVVTEHLRDLPNFLAYTIGFLHFYSRLTWLESFRAAGFHLVEEQKTTRFISTFILKN